MESADEGGTEAVIRRFIDRFNDGDRDGFAATLADGFVFVSGGSTHDADAFVEVEFAYFDAFPDFSYTLDDLRTAGELTGFRWTVTGTHEGAGGPGILADAAPTGKSVEVTGLNVARIEGDTIAELWGEWNGLGLYNQLGLVTPANG